MLTQRTSPIVCCFFSTDSLQRLDHYLLRLLSSVVSPHLFILHALLGIQSKAPLSRRQQGCCINIQFN